MSTPLVSVIIPTRKHESITVATESLLAQTIQDFEIIVAVDRWEKGQSWARNQAAASARGQYLLFSDSDINWQPHALEKMLRTFRVPHNPDGWTVGYVYCGYQLKTGDTVLEEVCNRPWSWEDLRHFPYISTMSLVERNVFTRFGFDESFSRLEDWDLWLAMGFSGFCGVWCGEVLFDTQLRIGISYGGPVDHTTAELQLRAKYHLP